MFDLGWSKILILAAVAIVFVGPKELPGLLRTLGQMVAQLRRHAAEFRTQFDEAIKSTELEQIKKDVQAIKSDAQASLHGIGQTLEKDLAAEKAALEKSLETVDSKVLSSAVEPDIPIKPEASSSAPSKAAERDPLAVMMPADGAPPAPVAIDRVAHDHLVNDHVANDPGIAPPAKTGT